MIVSASRRTDIPAFYAKWLFGRIAAGYAVCQNPMNPKQARRVSLIPEDVDGFVFWTKNPLPMLPYLQELSGYSYYFQFTITPYGREMEPGLPDKKQLLLPAAEKLSRLLGPHSVVWRYDPIFLSQKYPLSYHLRAFEQMAKALCGVTDTCVISFLDDYAKIKLRMGETQALLEGDMGMIAGQLARIAAAYNICVCACCEPADLARFGVQRAACVDVGRLSAIAGREILASRDKNQRKNCMCAASVDIGAYHTCINGCKYCYACRSFLQAMENYPQHDPGAERLRS